MPQSLLTLERFFADLKPLLATGTAGTPSPPQSGALADFFRQLSPLLEAQAMEGHAADLWQVMGLGRNEVRTTRILAWLIDPAGSHGFRNTVLEALWSHLPADVRPFPLSAVRGVQRETVPLGNGENRVDIEVMGADFLLMIEVKIDASDQPNQLVRYQQVAAEKARLRRLRHHGVLYLTCRPRPDCGRNIVNITWADVARAIETAARHRPATALGTQLAKAFAIHVGAL